jgi:hypothetical protein
MHSSLVYQTPTAYVKFPAATGSRAAQDLLTIAASARAFLHDLSGTSNALCRHSGEHSSVVVYAVARRKSVSVHFMQPTFGKRLSGHQTVWLVIVDFRR